LAERWLPKPKVAGSTPVVRSRKAASGELSAPRLWTSGMVGDEVGVHCVVPASEQQRC
jgi:hypothetical protein